LTASAYQFIEGRMLYLSSAAYGTKLC